MKGLERKAEQYSDYSDLDFLECDIPLSLRERNILMELLWLEYKTTENMQRKEEAKKLHDKLLEG